MQVSAGDPLDLRVRVQQTPQRVHPLDDADTVHPPDTGLERRMMHEQECRSRGRFFQPRLQPGQSFRTDRSVVGVGECGIQPDEPQRISLDHVADKLISARKIVVIAERRSQIPWHIVIARDQVDRSFQRSQQVAQRDVLVRSAPIGQIAGPEHHVGPRVECVQHRNRRPQVGIVVDTEGALLAVRADVKVTDLGNEHGLPPAGSGHMQTPHGIRSPRAAESRADFRMWLRLGSIAHIRKARGPVLRIADRGQ